MPNIPFTFYALKDRARGSLSADITASATSFVLNSGEGIKFSASDFCVWIDQECIYVGTRTTDTFSSLTRGYNGTTAASHEGGLATEEGAVVYQAADAALFKRFQDNLEQHTHNKADIPDFAHNHPQGDITNLVSDLATKEATANKGAASGYASLDSNTRVPNAQLGTGTPDSTMFLRGDRAWAVPGGGSDPWTYLQVNSGSDFTTTSASAVDVTGLSFAPAANTTYEFEAWLMIRTATATVNPRVGLAWATGGTDGVGMIEESQSTTSIPIAANGNINAALLIGVGGLPNATQSWPVRVQGLFRAGASPSGSVRIQLASETAGTTVRIVARSFLKYRTLSF